MAKLVIGTNKQTVVPAVVRDMSPAHYIEKTVDANGKLKNSTNIINLNGVTDVGDYILAYAYRQTSFPANTSVDFSSLTTVSGSNACYYTFYRCTGITSVDLSGLTTITGPQSFQSMFEGCTDLSSVDLSNLTTMNGSCNSMFASCKITSIDLSSLTTINSSGSCGSMFNGCTGLISVDLSGLTTALAYGTFQEAFSGCISLTTVYIGGTTEINFGTRTNHFQNMFQNCTQNIDVYAPAANQSQIESFSGYPNFGGTGTVTWHWRS